MKTKLHTTAIITIITVLFSANVLASEFNFKEESYIDDIPFDTKQIVNTLIASAIDFEEEAYINDIPFNTKKVAANIRYEQALRVDFDMEEEPTIDDMPFSTETIVENMNNGSIEFELDDEAYIDDIPFDTNAISAMHEQSRNAELFASGK